MTTKTLNPPRRSMSENLFSFKEFGDLSRIAWPLILSSLVSMSVSITDVIMIGNLGTTELAAAAAASDFYSIFFYLAAGVAAAIAPMIAQARGRKSFRDIKTIWVQGFICSALMGIPAAIAVYNAPLILGLIGVKADIVETGAPYAHMMAIALFPMLAVSVMHYFLSAVHRTRIILTVTALSLPVNITGNYMFLYGNFGAPELGVAGAGVASIVTGLFMFASLLFYAMRHPGLRRYLAFPMLKHKSAELRREVFRIGLPIGISHFGEMGVFLCATVTMGVFGAETLAAHTIALRMTGVFYAIPIAYSQAAMVRIGFLYGQDDTAAIRQAIRTILSFAVFAGIALMFLVITIKSLLPPLFVDADQITQTLTDQASSFLLAMAIMQPALLVGTIAGGILRGFKDSKVPMYFSLVCYWGLGFLGAMLLAFVVGMQGMGIWVGLGAATFGFALLNLWRISSHYQQPAPQMVPLRVNA